MLACLSDWVTRRRVKLFQVQAYEAQLAFGRLGQALFAAGQGCHMTAETLKKDAESLELLQRKYINEGYKLMFDTTLMHEFAGQAANCLIHLKWLSQCASAQNRTTPAVQSDWDMRRGRATHRP
eukprot:4913145-Amphidinium_carterae.1